MALLNATSPPAPRYFLRPRPGRAQSTQSASSLDDSTPANAAQPNNAASRTRGMRPALSPRLQVSWADSDEDAEPAVKTERHDVKTKTKTKIKSKSKPRVKTEPRVKVERRVKAEPRVKTEPQAGPSRRVVKAERGTVKREYRSAEEYPVYPSHPTSGGSFVAFGPASPELLSPSAGSPPPPDHVRRTCPVAAAISRGRAPYNNAVPTGHRYFAQPPAAAAPAQPPAANPAPAPAPARVSPSPSPLSPAPPSPSLLSPATPSPSLSPLSPVPSPHASISPGLRDLHHRATPQSENSIPRRTPPPRAYNDPATRPISPPTVPTSPQRFTPVPLHQLFPPQPAPSDAEWEVIASERTRASVSPDREELYNAELSRLSVENEAPFLAHMHDMSRQPAGHPARLSAHSLLVAHLAQWYKASPAKPDHQLIVLQQICRRAGPKLLAAFGVSWGRPTMGYAYLVEWTTDIALELHAFAMEPEADASAYVDPPAARLDDVESLIDTAEERTNFFFRYSGLPPHIMSGYNASRARILDEEARLAAQQGWTFDVSDQWRLIKNMEMNERGRASSLPPKRKLDDDEDDVLYADRAAANWPPASRPTKRAKPSPHTRHKRSASATACEVPELRGTVGTRVREAGVKHRDALLQRRELHKFIDWCEAIAPVVKERTNDIREMLPEGTADNLDRQGDDMGDFLGALTEEQYEVARAYFRHIRIGRKIGYARGLAAARVAEFDTELEYLDVENPYEVMGEEEEDDDEDEEDEDVEDEDEVMR
ncbi:hypothetical protein Q8F55_008056 [Vanrija albida]|uniref:Uncharacterized protein n=1 Tax=Vanrija albida TaxID=181172 RepID=A0ABR3PW59_9TREE